MNNLGYYNGKIGLIEEMSIPMTDRAYYFGDGVYEAVLCRNNIPYLLSVHIDRLFNGCRELDITPPIDKHKLTDLICELVKRVEGQEKFIYFHVSRGSALRSHIYEPGNGNLCVMITPFSVGSLTEGVDTVTYEDIRYSLCHIKTLNLLPSVLAAQFARDKKCDEAIFVHKGVVTEGSHCNISIIKNGTVITHPADCHILAGVSRGKMIKYALEYGIAVCERRYGIDELMNADEVIITSTGKIIRAVKTVNGIVVGGKNQKILSVLRDMMYNDYISSTDF